METDTVNKIQLHDNRVILFWDGFAAFAIIIEEADMSFFFLNEMI